jgi:hypothetical protein
VVELVWVALGLTLLVGVTYDVCSTVLHHWGGAGPLSGRIAHGVWRLAVGLSGRLGPARRRRLLGAVGPLMIPLIVALWSGATILGFALLYFPWIVPHFAPDSGVPDPTGFGDALHFSGVSFFTIGYGDVVPVSGVMRTLGVIEGGAGFAMVTLVISYFTSLYAGYSQQKTTAQSMYYQAGMSADAARVIAWHMAGGATDSLIQEIGRLRDGMAAIRSDYGNYPILHYFIAARPEQSLARLLFVVHDLRLLLDTVLDPERCPAVAGLGERSGLLAAVAAVHSGIAETLQRRPLHDDLLEPVSDQVRDAWRKRFEHARALLAEQGLAVRTGPGAVEEYCRGRGEWELALRLNAQALGEDWEEVAGGF